MHKTAHWHSLVDCPPSHLHLRIRRTPPHHCNCNLPAIFPARTCLWPLSCAHVRARVRIRACVFARWRPSAGAHCIRACVRMGVNAGVLLFGCKRTSITSRRRKTQLQTVLPALPASLSLRHISHWQAPCRPMSPAETRWAYASACYCRTGCAIASPHRHHLADSRGCDAMPV